MSELTQCNYCPLRKIRERAKQRKQRVVLIPSSFMAGTEVFAVPSHIKKKDILKWNGPGDKLPNGDENWRKYHTAWMMTIPDHCGC